MSRAFEELDRQTTPIGEISLRRRLEPVLQVDVFEVKLGDEFLMSSLFTATEEAVATLGLAACTGERLDVLVGGLGLGYTAASALRDPRVARLRVIELLEPVVDWHRRELVPMAATVLADERCTIVQGDFFAFVGGTTGGTSGDADDEAAWASVWGERGARPCDAILLDIDHTPDHLLDDAHAGFYSDRGLRAVRDRLVPGGVFSLWSDDPPDGRFVDLLGRVFADVTPHVVAFPNHYTGGESACTVYVAVRPTGDA